MELPGLNKTKRKREYNLYKEEIRDKIVYCYLFEGASHRTLDEKILNLDSEYSRGWQSMGVLHYLGITNKFKGIFKSKNIEEVLRDVSKIQTQEYIDIYDCLHRYYERNYIDSQMQFDIAKETTVYTAGKISEYSAEDFPDLSNNEEIYEGLKKTVIVNKYERSSLARKKCIEQNGCYCQICNMSFEKIYGELGKEFIHVHHVKPVSEIDQTYVIDYKNDLLPICPNCHAMIHRKLNGEKVSIDQLKRIYSYCNKLND